MLENIDLERVRSLLSGHIINLKKLTFHFSNPIIWLFLLFMFVFLAPRWRYQKSFLFCFLVGVIIFSINPLEGFFVGGLGLERGVMSLVLFFLLSLVVIYFVFLKDND